ncbi:hypothetical protein ScPMuIL_013030 [Solemya velum]
MRSHRKILMHFLYSSFLRNATSSSLRSTYPQSQLLPFQHGWWQEDIATDKISIEPFDAPGTTIHAPYDRTYPAEEYDNKDLEDNCALMYLNEATLLHNIRIRYMKNQIYTYTANILIAVNPYYGIPDLYSSGTIKKYQGKSLGVLPPHVFAIADKAFRDMKVTKHSQSIVVSGESGAGKTESTKYILKYLCESWGSRAGDIEQRILECNPLLEAFGNAKTVRNNNSSRFGKFIEIHFDGKNVVAGGYISHYLLEKSRIVTQGPDERNYHIFFRLCAGAPEELRKQLRLGSPDSFNYMNQGCTQYFCGRESLKTLSDSRKSKQYLKSGSLHDTVLDDVRDFKLIDDAMAHLRVDQSTRMSIYALVAAVLHLGNIGFEENHEDTKGGCMVSSASEGNLSVAATLLAVDKDELKDSLISRVMQTTKGGVKGTVIKVPLKVYEAQNARDALAKSVYSRMFDYIVLLVNQAIPFKSTVNFIGLLDIAGFEYFQVNSFEQSASTTVMRNCNSSSMREFSKSFFSWRKKAKITVKNVEMGSFYERNFDIASGTNLYEKEGLNVKKITWTDNQDCIELIEMKISGIFDLLDEESKLPTPKYDHFSMEVHNRNKNHFRLSFPRKSKLKSHRDVRDEEGFLIRHFAGAVCYHTKQFIDKNNDALHASLEFLIKDSKNPLLQKLYEGMQVSSGKLNFSSVGSKFRSQLRVLMEKLKSTGTNFVRCIKPNLKMVDHLFEGSQILSQLECSGMHSVLDLMQQGFPSRTLFADLYNMYKKYLPPELSRLDPRLFCKALFKALGLSDKDFKFGLTKVFFRPGKFAEFDEIMKSDPENLAKLIAKVKRWLICSRWKKAQWCTLSVIKLKNKILFRQQQIVMIQKTIRMWKTVREFRPKFQTVTKMKSLQAQLKLMEQIAGQLKKDKDQALNKVQEMVKSLELNIQKIRFTKMSRLEMEQAHALMMKTMDTQLVDIKKMLEKQKNREEQERLKKIQEEMERERKKKEEEERKRKQEEEERKLKSEMEARRKKEEDERKKREVEETKRKAEIDLHLAKDAEENKRRQQVLDQEHRDRELALRLAAEDEVEDIVVPQLQRSEAVRAQRQELLAKKYDLTKWKYAELRDAINTSCDLEMLEACREEFHRRLKVYHSWKVKNKKQNDSKKDERAPETITQNSNYTVSKQNDKGSDVQRFFHIPFARPADEYRDGSERRQGMWYAHFDGHWIARQMELYPDKQPVLLLAGIDDMQMCELSIEETGLAKKKGAEMLGKDFEDVWKKHGGAEYLKKHAKRVSSKFLQKRLGLL